MFTSYIFMGASAALALSIGLNLYQGNRIDALKANATVNKVELAACGARLNNLVEDIRDDQQIDNLPDDALRNVPDEWLRPLTAD